MPNTVHCDIDPLETAEWLEALKAVVEHAGTARAEFLLKTLGAHAQMLQVDCPASRNTPYCNTRLREEKLPEDHGLAQKVSAVIRWNAMMMVLRAGKKAPELGGHIATYASASLLYEMGFNHFFKAKTDTHPGDLLYIQGHASPGIYARAFLEGRLTETQLMHFRQEVEAEGQGISSYPHPWLMPDFWQFATVSMGLGPLQAIYQARFLKYLENRGLCQNKDRKVWVFLGDGEMDEPESLGALTVAAREGLDNLIFVVNCNLQRLDGPVRGNGKIIQELESLFLGAGWRVIKVIWGSLWDPLFAKDEGGFLMRRMAECVDGDFQAYVTQGGAYMREHFFGRYPELAKMVEDWSDEEIAALNRGGHDPQKVFAAYHEAWHTQGVAVAILAKTVKGYGMGTAGEGQNITHQQKKMTEDQLRVFRDRFNIPIPDHQIAELPFLKPEPSSPEMQYLLEQRQKLGGFLPKRQVHSESLTVPALSAFDTILEGSGDRALSTTMVFVRILNLLLKNSEIGARIVPIVPDECRTFGMEGLFRQIGIYSHLGQLYTPPDRAEIMYYREAKEGQILEEGISEGGAFCSWIAAATSYSTNGVTMIPFYIYYSMFGFQRIGDLAWAAGDMQARGFLLGATSGRTTLAGEGLQHQDGHSHVLAATIPNCIAYDPTFGYELAVIIQNGLERMVERKENVFYYITVMNENYNHPPISKGSEAGIIQGMYLLKKMKAPKIQLLGSGAILREVIAAAALLESDFGISADIWSVTSFTELKREAARVVRWNRMHPEKLKKAPYVSLCLNKTKGPVLAATDYVCTYADQIRPYLSKKYVVLGTDGFGRSDTRQKLRHFFEVDAKFIVQAALYALAEEGVFSFQKISAAMQQYGIDSEKADPALA